MFVAVLDGQAGGDHVAVVDCLNLKGNVSPGAYRRSREGGARNKGGRREIYGGKKSSFFCYNLNKDLIRGRQRPVAPRSVRLCVSNNLLFIIMFATRLY